MGRTEQLLEHLDLVRELFVECSGNRVRVREELSARGVDVRYTTLTDFCRRHQIGVRPKKRAGRYHFDPGEEMQHDTSPHRIEIGGKRELLQCASLVLCYSRLMYSQVYQRWRRFTCRQFISEALAYFDGTARRCMIDNSSVVIAHGSGADAVIAAEMESLSKRFGFRFEAHAVGDANRSARVERPFHYIENNFYAGRRFESLEDLNKQLRAWCDRVNLLPKRVLGTTPRELYGAERAAMVPLPPYLPEVYDLHSRRVDVEGYVALHTNRYSVPADLIGHRVELRETKERVRIFEGHRLVAEHRIHEYGRNQRLTLPEHEYRQGRRGSAVQVLPEEKVLRSVSPPLLSLVDELKKHHAGRSIHHVRWLFRIYQDYPLEVIDHEISRALSFGLIDLERIERMILRNLNGQLFALPADPEPEREKQNERRSGSTAGEPPAEENPGNP